MKKVFVLSAIALLATTSNVMATIPNFAVAQYDTRAIDVAVDYSDYKASWLAQTSVINYSTLADFNGAVIPGGVTGGFSHLTVSFNANTAGSQWGFRLAPDAGLGGAIYLDGNLLNKKTNDLWFGWNSWDDATILQATNVAVTASNHVFEGFWAEGCCNGNQFLQYTTDGQNWQSMAELAAPAAVPVPAALWLFSSAFVGILGISRRK